MNDEVTQRTLAVQRFFAGEKPEAICVVEEMYRGGNWGE